MDKETLSNYGWIVILVLILAVMLALATPFGTFVADAVKSTTAGFFSVNQNAMGAAGITIPGQEFESCEHDYEVTTTANCTAAGTTTYTCKLCGKTYSEETPAGHTFDNASDLSCNNCNASFVNYSFIATDYDAKMGTTTATDSVVVIPETFEYDGTNYKVVSIGDYAFSNCTSLTEVIIPKTATKTTGHSFYNCTSLSSVKMTDSMTTIGWYSFYGCTALESIYLPESITRLDQRAFANSGITSIGPRGSGAALEIPTKVTTLTAGLFSGCPKLETVHVPDTITGFGEATFGSNDALKSVKLPDHITVIYLRLFQGCNNLETINISRNVKEIQKRAFAYTWSLTIQYEGTQEEWNAITKAAEWNYQAGGPKVNCLGK